MQSESLNIRYIPAPTTIEHELMIAIHNRANPDWPSTMVGWMHRERTREKDIRHDRCCVEREGVMVAYGVIYDAWWLDDDARICIDVVVDPDTRDAHGVARYLFEHLLGQVDTDVSSRVQVHTYEDRPSRMAMLEELGFEQALRMPLSEIDVRGFEPSPYDGLFEKVRSSGVRLVSGVELTVSDPDYRRKCWDLDWEIDQDIPQLGAPRRWTFERFEKVVFESPAYMPGGIFVALDGEDYVGLSTLQRSLADSERFHVGVTGVIRSHRRRGIATALKVNSILFARERGVHVIDTDNEENNPMYQINVALGFKPRPAAICYLMPLAS